MRPEQGMVVVVLSNDVTDTILVAGPLVDAVAAG